MSLLFKHFRIHQVFGANTDVGKTVFTTALAIASASKGHAVYYLKPVSTGPPDDADDLKIQHFTNSGVQADCLFRFSEPVSPHLAVKVDGVSESAIPTDKTFVNAISDHIRRHARKTSTYGHMYVETAGGVHSPTLLGTPQADCYRPLLLPTILVGDSKLGGISSTISAYESLVIRGYTIDTVLLFKDSYYQNWEYLTHYFNERGIFVKAVDAPPPLTGNTAEDQATTAEYYKTITSQGEAHHILDVIDHLDNQHSLRFKDLESSPSRALASTWWPFVQHGTIENASKITVIDSAHSDFFSIYKPGKSGLSNLEPQFDGSASWWTQAVGHAHPRLTLAAARAAGRYGHVMFPSNTHTPALKLSESLLQGPGKGWASRVFFSDDGSTGMEVALKMALRTYGVRSGSPAKSERSRSMGIVGLKGSYHGDTIGAMDACEEGVYTCEWHNAKGFWFDPPTVGITQGKVTISSPSSLGGEETVFEDLHSVYDVETRLQSKLADSYRTFIRSTLTSLHEKGPCELSALVLEPLVMGAGGMIFVDPLFQRIMIDVVRSSDSPLPASLPVIFDEVFVGLYRIGMETTSPTLGATPDISVHAKILTGGLLPLAVTLATESVFDVFKSASKADALLHGHSYSAHPVGCEVANETLGIIEDLKTSELWTNAQSRWSSEPVADISEEIDEETPAEDTSSPSPSYSAMSPPRVWSLWDPSFVYQVSKNEQVAEVMALGTVFVIKMKATDAGYLSNLAESTFLPLRTASNEVASSAPGGAPHSIHFRTLGNVAYFMTSLNTPSDVIREIEDRIWSVLQKPS